MCPACVTSYLLLLTAGTTSAGSLAAFAVRRLLSQADRKHETDEKKQNEN
jgi:hypothetical protein